MPANRLSPARRLYALGCSHKKKARLVSGLSFLRLGESSHNRVPSTSDVLEADGRSVWCRLEY